MEKLGGKSEFNDKDIEAALLKFIIMERLPLSKLNSKYLKTLMKGSSIIIYFLFRFSGNLIYFLIFALKNLFSLSICENQGRSENQLSKVEKRQCTSESKGTCVALNSYSSQIFQVHGIDSFIVYNFVYAY